MDVDADKIVADYETEIRTWKREIAYAREALKAKPYGEELVKDLDKYVQEQWKKKDRLLFIELLPSIASVDEALAASGFAAGA